MLTIKEVIQMINPEKLNSYIELAKTYVNEEIINNDDLFLIELLLEDVDQGNFERAERILGYDMETHPRETFVDIVKEING